MSYYIIESKRFQRGLPISFIILKSWIKDDIVDGKVNNIYIYIYIYISYIKLYKCYFIIIG